MKTKLLKITELLKAEKAYNNIPYILGMLETMIMDLEWARPDKAEKAEKVEKQEKSSKSHFWK